MNNAIINIPENLEGIKCDTNNVHPVVIVNALSILSKHFARELVKMAKKEVGNNPKLQEQWLDRITKKYLGSKGDLNLDDINRLN
jgi:hypothetical protein